MWRRRKRRREREAHQPVRHAGKQERSERRARRYDERMGNKTEGNKTIILRKQNGTTETVAAIGWETKQRRYQNKGADGP